MEIIITNHAVIRMKERFRLLFPDVFFQSKFHTKFLIEKLMKDSYEDIKWKQSPFYVNKITSRYGPTHIFVKGSVHFICAMNGDKVFVKTVVNKFNNV